MGATKKERADVLLFEAGLAESRAQARALIMAGKVRMGPDRVVSKPSEKIPVDADLTVDAPREYVSRGAYKLLPALDRHLPDLSGMTALDVGASTGGFTDLMLQRGAERVYCVDSGRGQLHDKLRRDPRVVCLERTNARFIDETLVPEKVDALTMDVSFISATLLLEPCSRLTRDGAWAFILVKPQFEAGKGEVPRGGVVTDERVIRDAIDKVAGFATGRLGWTFLEAIPSPIKGPKGNQEFIAVFRTAVPVIP